MEASPEGVKLSAATTNGTCQKMLADALTLGPFIVAPSGRLALREPGCRPAFTFVWRRRVSAVLEGDAVKLRAALGRVPSTASDAARRPACFAVLAWLAQHDCPTGWSFHLQPDHRLEVSAQETLAWPATVPDLLQPLVRFVLALSPYLDLLEENGL